MKTIEEIKKDIKAYTDELDILKARYEMQVGEVTENINKLKLELADAVLNGAAVNPEKKTIVNVRLEVNDDITVIGEWKGEREVRTGDSVKVEIDNTAYMGTVIEVNFDLTGSNYEISVYDYEEAFYTMVQIQFNGYGRTYDYKLCPFDSDRLAVSVGDDVAVEGFNGNIIVVTVLEVWEATETELNEKPFNYKYAYTR